MQQITNIHCIVLLQIIRQINIINIQILLPSSVAEISYR